MAGWDKDSANKPVDIDTSGVRCYIERHMRVQRHDGFDLKKHEDKADPWFKTVIIECGGPDGEYLDLFDLQRWFDANRSKIDELRKEATYDPPTGGPVCSRCGKTVAAGELKTFESYSPLVGMWHYGRHCPACVHVREIKPATVVHGSDPMRIVGLVETADRPNRNRRMYSLSLLKRVVADAQEAIAARTLKGGLYDGGEFDPTVPDPSHVILRMWMQGDQLWAEAEILPTPEGIVLRKMFEAQCNLPLRLFGVGSGKVNDDGVLVVADDYKLNTIGVVVVAGA